MKRSLGLGITLIVLISGITLSPVPANAVFGLSKCEKVKAQVLAYEKTEKGFEAQYEPVNGKWSWFFSSAHSNDYWVLQKKIVDFEVNMFAYVRSNAQCFTTKQRAYANSVYYVWKHLQTYLRAQPDWINGFSFVPIVWDSIYSER